MQYDLVVILILVLATVHGTYRGFVSQLATIAALILAFVFAGPVSTQLAPFISLDPPLDRWVAMLAAYVVLSLGCFMVARTLRGAIDKARLVEYDRHLGGVFGFLKGGVFCLVLTFFLVTLFENLRPYIVGTPQGHPSKTGYLSALILDRLYPVVPAEFAEVVDRYLHEYDDAGVAFQHTHEEGHEHARPHAPGDGDTAAHDHAGHAHGDDHDHAHGGSIGGEVPPVPVPRERPIGRYPGASPRQPATQPAAPPTVREPPVATIPPSPPSVSPAAPADRAPAYRTLLIEVVALYAWDRAEQDALLRDVEGTLFELPPAVAELVVWDWHADLVGTFADPDPATDASWSLGERMLRQLTLADAQPNEREPIRRTARDARR
ncbi:MAG: CvpA family protein [Planctomycetaceae bacterium]